jgi:hypothetical protein
MDTTHHWWAVTQPFADHVRIIVDGKQSDVYSKIRNLTFSPDGSRWACFALDNNGQISILSNEGNTKINGTDFGKLKFSPDSRELIYSSFIDDYLTIHYSNKYVKIYKPYGDYFVNFDGSRIAFLLSQGDRFILNINGVESELYDEIKPIGFWYDGRFMFAARNGSIWQVYRGSESLTEPLSNVTECAINLVGNCASVIARRTSGEFVGILISDDYTEPLIGRLYSWAGNMSLHPYLPMMAYIAQNQDNMFMVLNSTEYFAGKDNGKPKFTFDGSELYYPTCNIDCNVCVNGRNYTISSQIPLNIVKKPGSPTIAYSTSSSLVVMDIEKSGMFSGKMMDSLSNPRYNRFTDRYEALGIINQRLYLLGCQF